MDDLDVLARDFGLGARGKSNPMRSTAPDRRSIDDPFIGNVFGGQPKYASSSNFGSINNQGDFDYDSIFKSSAATEPLKNSNSNVSSMPVYDKPVYDDDIFDGLPGLKSKSPAPSVKFDDDVFVAMSSPSTGNSRNREYDDLLGNLGRKEKVAEENISSGAKSSSSSKGYDDFLAGFGSSNSSVRDRPVPESRWGSMPTSGSKNGLDDPFVVLESSSTPQSSSTVSKDPLEEFSNLSKSRSSRAEVSSGSRGAFDDLDSFSTFAKSASLSTGRDKREKDGSPSRSETPEPATAREPMDNSYFGYSESNNMNRVPVDEEPPLFDVPNVSTGFQKSSGQTSSPPQYYETVSEVDMTPTTGQGNRPDEVWLTVSEIPLFTQPTAAPPPSRPPPPIPRQASMSETGSFSSSSRKKGDEFLSSSNYNQHSQTRPSAKGPPVSQFDELEDFAKGRSHNSVDESANLHHSTETNDFSTADASAAAMKDAMDKAEAKFRHAKEVREREYAKAARNREPGPIENDEQDRQEEFKESQERLERERRQKEEEEREQRRLERERLRETEREKARQAVERATREARERAAAEARERATAEARLKSERAAVEKANAEARGRAERAAVQRAQAEARERAAAEAKGRAEKAAAEARERAAAEAKEKEAREKSAAARAEAEARRRAERAAVERAAAEARERAAAEARERAASAAKMNQQKNDNDLESFFSMGRASSAPRARSSSTDPFFDQQFPGKGESEAARRTPSSTGASSNLKKASSTTNFVDDLSSIFGAPASGEFPEVEGENEERRRARMERHQRTQERAAKALAEKNQRDLQAQREQEERHRIAETLDFEIKRWAAGKETNLRALLSTLQYVLWPECGWQPVSLTDLITGASVKKVYRKATLCIHPDKVQQKGATLQQKYIAEKVFDLLKEAWNKFNSEELF
ncbi:auxilin-related protein 2-like isoform X2 [Salvia miltiorrhiza]|uniref:auxilin-related protein 2-like isoform X2 n=1 Tax=Salvia miltiorrhiza TaxID=226208 RepID=UPI0025AC4DB0|nr:auxilin-related protein 2-like isoform X2 [Salvia miltiorrhiza]